MVYRQGDFSTCFLARVLNVGCIGNVGVSRDRIELPEAVGTMPFVQRLMLTEYQIHDPLNARHFY